MMNFFLIATLFSYYNCCNLTVFHILSYKHTDQQCWCAASVFMDHGGSGSAGSDVPVCFPVRSRRSGTRRTNRTRRSSRLWRRASWSQTKVRVGSDPVPIWFWSGSDLILTRFWSNTKRSSQTFPLHLLFLHQTWSRMAPVRSASSPAAWRRRSRWCWRRRFPW